MIVEDSKIVDLFFERQELAIAETKIKYGNRLFRSSLNILYNTQDAEECVNDTLLKAWEAIPPNRPTKLGAFLAKIARNLSLNKWKAKNTQRRGSGEVSYLLDELEECLSNNNNNGNSPEQEYESSRIVDVINSCLSNMELEMRIAFVERYFHGDSILDISLRHRISQSKVKSLLFRARNKLRTHLEEEEIRL